MMKPSLPARRAFFALPGVLLVLSAQPDSRASPMPVQSVTRNDDGATLTLQPGILKLRVCDERILRVTYAPGAALPERSSFVVTNTWPATPPFELEETPDEVTLSTAALRVAIDRATGALRFLDPSGGILLEEPADGGKSMTPVTVNGESAHRPMQVFRCPADEALFGLGQYQEGLWNYRGIPLQLRQSNTQIAVPMLLSSRGYGLLWDNASLTDFNPADDPVPIDPNTRTGTFHTDAAGDYVFMVRDGDLDDEIGVSVDGVEVVRIVNTWVPHSVSGRIRLPADTDCTVRLLGGGPDARVYARPLGDTTVFRSEIGDAIDYYFFYGPAWDEVIAGYRRATGAVPMLPKWALGFWQSRERYATQQEVLDAAAGYRDRRIPIDLVVQDWQYWGSHGWGAYEWDSANYPDPQAMIDELHGRNLRFMISIWPNPQGALGEALAAMTPDGRIPGGAWMDVFNPAVRGLCWDHMNSAFFSIGTDAWWQDATEPGDDGDAMVDRIVQFESVPTSGNRLRNAYSLFTARAAYEGQRGAGSPKRVVNLTRSGYAGQQRYGTICWSGDVKGDWTTFRRQIPAGLNFSLSGIPWWTTDTGGFFRPADQYESSDYNELLIRWFQWSAFCPVLRVHGYRSETEVWNYLPTTEAVLLDFIDLRYRMLPYNYSVAWMVSRDGSTMLRALPMDFPEDPAVRGVSDEYMFGPAFLVSPVTSPGAVSRTVYLPAGTDWIDFWTGERLGGGRTIETTAPIDRIPLHVRAGSIVPFGPELQWTGEKPSDPIELRIYRGADGEFTIYDDAGDGYAYEQGAFAEIPIRWEDAAGVLRFGERQGAYDGMPTQRLFRVLWVGPEHGHGPPRDFPPDLEVAYTGAAVAVEISDVSVPAAPTGLTADPGPGRILLSWDAVPGATAYEVRRSPTAGGPHVTVADGLADSGFTDNSVVPGAEYFYVVIAENLAGRSPPSEEASARAAIPPSFTWNAPGGVWDTVSTNWLDGATPTVWRNEPARPAIFGPAGAGEVEIVTNVTAGGLVFEAPGYRIAGGALSLGGGYPVAVAEFDAVVSAWIVGSSDLFKLGPARLTFDGLCEYTGRTSVLEGVLVLRGATAIDAFRSSASLAAGAVLELDITGFGGVHTDGLMDPDQPAIGRGGSLDLAGDGVLRIVGGPGDVVGIGNTAAGPVVNIALGTPGRAGSGRIEIEGGALVNGGWQGAVWTNNVASMHIAADAAFDIWDGRSVRIDTLSGDGSLTNGSNSPRMRTLTIGVNGGSGVFRGRIGGGGGAGAGLDRIELVKTGSGTQTLEGASTYLGDTVVQGGALLINGSLASPSVTVAPGALLGGEGVLAGGVTVEGVIAPGSGGIGVLHAGPTTIRGGTYLCELDAVSSDVLAVDGPATVEDGTLTFGILGEPRAASYTLLTCAGPSPSFDHVQDMPMGYELDGDSEGVIRLIRLPGYRTWAADRGVGGGPYEDDDGDGIENFVEYALGLDPGRADPSPGVMDGVLVVFAKGAEAVAAGDVSYAIETSETLLPGSWTPVVPETDDPSVISCVLPTEGVRRLFARLRVEWIRP